MFGMAQQFRRSDGPANLSMLGNFVSGAFTPVLAKHSTNFSIIDSLAIGVDRIQRNFEPTAGRVVALQATHR